MNETTTGRTRQYPANSSKLLKFVYESKKSVTSKDAREHFSWKLNYVLNTFNLLHARRLVQKKKIAGLYHFSLYPKSTAHVRRLLKTYFPNDNIPQYEQTD